MITPPPETPVAGETLEQIAEREAASFAEDWALTTETQRDLEYVILSALRNEREHCANMAHKYIAGAGYKMLANDCAAVIRKGK